jgi:hypothetical protein
VKSVGDDVVTPYIGLFLPDVLAVVAAAKFTISVALLQILMQIR